MSVSPDSPRRPGRASPLPRDERRATLIEVTSGLLLEYGREVTTRQIAEAADVAEGTIFRAFDSKDELVEEAIRAAFAPGAFIEGLRAIEPDQDLPGRLTDIVRVVQRRFVEVFALMSAVGMIGPPPDREGCDEEDGSEPWQGEANARMLELVEPDRSLLRVEPAELLHLMRLLTFSGSHREIAHGRPLTPEQIVDVLLRGTLVPGSGDGGCAAAPHDLPLATATTGDTTC